MPKSKINHTHSKKSTRSFNRRVFVKGAAAAAVVGLPAGSALRSAADDPIYDVVVYGGTSAGVIAAVQSARLGRTVILIEPTRHLGGLTTGGLGQTDSGIKATIGGLSREFYQRIRAYYEDPTAWRQERRDNYMNYDGRGSTHLVPNDDAQWGFEPHVALKLYHDMLEEANVPLVMEERLVLQKGEGVKVEDGRIQSIRMESGREYRGRMFVDATYEGDLLAMAGVSYHVGRESNAAYGEMLNGVQKARTHNHVLVDGVSAYVVPGDPSSGLLPGVHGEDPGEDGEGDHRVQAYCFRMCLTDAPDNRVPFEKPEGYNELDYELLFRNFEHGETRIPWLPGRMPNRKTDTNNRWGVSTNMIGVNYDYPDGDYEERARVYAMQTHYQKGFMWTLANHPRVPEHVRNEVSRWGYAKDEFVDNDHWPTQIYVREARRMVGAYVTTEHDCRRMKVVEDPVGQGSYNMDSHNVQRYVTPEGYAQNEGNLEYTPGGPYLISYRSIIPKKEECENLFAVCAVSSSHIAYGSIRMEPVFMILGHSAATAAHQALDANVAVQDIDYTRLRAQLEEEGQQLDIDLDRYPPLPPPFSVSSASLEGVIVNNTDAVFTGEWETSTHVNPFVEPHYHHDQDAGKGEKQAVYSTRLPQSGRYEVRISYSPGSNRASNVPVAVVHANGEDTVTVNQRSRPRYMGLFTPIGEFEFSADADAQVIIGTEGTDGHVIADAVQFIPSES